MPTVQPPGPDGLGAASGDTAAHGDTAALGDTADSSGGRVDVSVVTSGHDVADARLHREVAAMRRCGLTVEVLGLGDPATGPAGARVRSWQRGSMPVRALRAVRLPWSARGRLLFTLDPDVIPSALLVGMLRRRPVAADVHEDYVALLADRAWVPPRLRGVLRRSAAWCVGLAGRAALTVVADHHLPPGPAGCRRRLVVRNLPDLSLLPDRPRVLRTALPLRAVYVGDVRTSRGLRAMVEAVAAAPPWQLDVVGPVAGADQPWLRERLRQPDVAGRVTLHGRRPPRQAWEIAERACVGMLLMTDTPAFREAVPTKLYEYLAMGLAVLATPLPRVGEIVTAAAAGELVEDAQAAARVLREWAADPDRIARARAAGLDWAGRELGGPNPYDQLAAHLAALITPVGAGCGQYLRA